MSPQDAKPTAVPLQACVSLDLAQCDGQLEDQNPWGRCRGSDCGILAGSNCPARAMKRTVPYIRNTLSCDLDGSGSLFRIT